MTSPARNPNPHRQITKLDFAGQVFQALVTLLMFHTLAFGVVMILAIQSSRTPEENMRSFFLGVGYIQVLYAVPMAIIYRNKRQTVASMTTLIGMALTLLLSSYTCFANMFH